MNLPSGKLMALVAVFAAIGVITGTGAFTTVSAERTASVNVAGDGSALLGLSASGSSYADVGSDGTLEIDMDGTDTDGGFGKGATGLNLNAKTTVEYMFTITNNGADEVAVSLQLRDNDDDDISDDKNLSSSVAFVVNKSQLAGTSGLSSSNIQISGEDVYSLSENKVDLGPGESIKVGMYIDTRDGDATDDGGSGTPSPEISGDDDLVDQIDIQASSEAADDDDDSNTGDLDAASP